MLEKIAGRTLLPLRREHPAYPSSRRAEVIADRVARSYRAYTTLAGYGATASRTTSLAVATGSASSI